MPFTYEYPRPALTTDVAAFALRGDRLKVCLVKRGKDPFAGRWVMPGGFVEIQERIEVAARREFKEETGLDAGRLRLLGPYDAPGRDPRGRVVSIAYLTAAGPDAVPSRFDEEGEVSDAGWRDALSPPPLGFDHEGMLADAVEGLRRLGAWTTALFDMLGPRFTAEALAGGLAAVYPEPPDAREAIERASEWGVIEPADGGGYRVAREADALLAARLRPLFAPPVKSREDEA